MEIDKAEVVAEVSKKENVADMARRWFQHDDPYWDLLYIIDPYRAPVIRGIDREC